MESLANYDSDDDQDKNERRDYTSSTNNSSHSGSGGSNRYHKSIDGTNYEQIQMDCSEDSNSSTNNGGNNGDNRAVCGKTDNNQLQQNDRSHGQHHKNRPMAMKTTTEHYSHKQESQHTLLKQLSKHDNSDGRGDAYKHRSSSRDRADKNKNRDRDVREKERDKYRDRERDRSGNDYKDRDKYRKRRDDRPEKFERYERHDKLEKYDRQSEDVRRDHRTNERDRSRDYNRGGSSSSSNHDLSRERSGRDRERDRDRDRERDDARNRYRNQDRTSLNLSDRNNHHHNHYHQQQQHQQQSNPNERKDEHRSRSKSRERINVPPALTPGQQARNDRNTLKVQQLKKMGIELTPQPLMANLIPPLMGTSTTTNISTGGNNPNGNQTVNATTGQQQQPFTSPYLSNPRYAEQLQKRKLLWGNKKNEEKPAQTTNKWEQAKFSQDTDGKVQSKFLRLMGMKDAPPTTATPSSSSSSTSQTAEDKSCPPDMSRKQDEMFSSMEQQYEVARQVTHTMRGMGLGFGSQPRPY